MLARAFRLATVGGIEVRLDPTLLVLAVLLVWSFSGQFAAEHGGTTAIGMAVAGMVLILLSILAHELAHALEARHRGIEVESITLLVFGGVTQMHAHSARPRDEFVIAAVGPFVSLLCGAVFGLLSVAAELLPTTIAGPAADLAGLLALLNVLLAVFNLVPGAPLDGGRVLRAGLWWILGDRSRAIRWAARCGQALGLALVGFGLFVLWQAPQAFVGALWWIVIGVFLVWAAGSEHRMSRLDDLYNGTTVRDLLPFVAAEEQPPDPADPTDPASAPTEDPGADLPDPAPGADLPDPAPGADLPGLPLDADLHDLVDAFQGRTTRIVLHDDQHTHLEVSERQIAAAIGRLRRGQPPVRTMAEATETPR